jgi:molybdopterin converting factor small subunit
MTVTIRYFAAARAAAETGAETLDVPEHCTLDELLREVRGRHGLRVSLVLPQCSFLLDGTSVRDRLARVPDGATLDVLPPFAGG